MKNGEEDEKVRGNEQPAANANKPAKQAAKKTAEKASNPRGFARGLRPREVISATDRGGPIKFLIGWHESDELDYVLAEEANIKCPHLVTKFYKEVEKIHRMKCFVL